MSGFDKRRLMLTLGLMTLLAAGAHFLSAQAPAATPVAPAGPSAGFPATPPTHEELGDTLAVHRRYQAAIEEYAKAPVSAAVWNKMGIAYQMMFNSKDATRCYRESLKLDPRNSQVLNNMGTVYDSLKEYGTAEHFYHKALKSDPRSPLILKNLGTNLLAQHKYSRGWEEYQKALALDPEIFEDKGSPQVQNPSTVAERGAMNYYMALGCARMGQVDCALQYLRMALDEGFTSPKKVASDTEFASLRDNPDFKQMLAAQSKTKAAQAR
ncbi:MAG: tetratricopeptide repeat protein [Terracidiphilus sp.]|jgi:Tfp pilus assembly protein PilF